MSKEIVALAVFVLAYALFVFLPGRRPLVAVAGVGLLMLTGTLGPWETFTSVNWNVMGIFVGTLIAADLFIESRFPAWFAEVVVGRAPNTAWALIFICAMTGAISAFVENVATVLIVAPVALSIARKLEINPVGVMIGIAISSNLQGAATLIGDPPSMLLAGHSKMTFMDFFFYQGKPGIFFAVELGAITSFAVLYWFYRKMKAKPECAMTESVQSWMPPIMLLALIVALAASSFFDKGFSYLAGLLCMVFGVVMLVWHTKGDAPRMGKIIRKLDWGTTIFLMGVFVLVESLAHTGWIEAISRSLSHAVEGRVFLGYVILVLVAIVVSAFVDNVPFLAAMLPVAGSMASNLGISPSLYLFGLLIGASMGGNITPIGASANIVACGLLKKEGHVVSFGEFARISVPFTLAAVIPAAAFVWFVWGP